MISCASCTLLYLQMRNNCLIHLLGNGTQIAETFCTRRALMTAIDTQLPFTEHATDTKTLELKTAKALDSLVCLNIGVPLLLRLFLLHAFRSFLHQFASSFCWDLQSKDRFSLQAENIIT